MVFKLNHKDEGLIHYREVVIGSFLVSNSTPISWSQLQFYGAMWSSQVPAKEMHAENQGSPSVGPSSRGRAFFSLCWPYVAAWRLVWWSPAPAGISNPDEEGCYRMAGAVQPGAWWVFGARLLWATREINHLLEATVILGFYCYVWLAWISDWKYAYDSDIAEEVFWLCPFLLLSLYLDLETVIGSLCRSHLIDTRI